MNEARINNLADRLLKPAPSGRQETHEEVIDRTGFNLGVCQLLSQMAHADELVEKERERESKN